MKNKASLLLKQFISVFKSIAKAKSMAIKNKTSAVKARLIMFSLLKSKQKLMLDSLSHKIHRLLGLHEGENEGEAGENSKALVLYNIALANESHSNSSHTQYLTQKGEADYEEEGDHGDGDGDDKYPDLRHCLFDEEDLELEEDDQGGSIIDLVRNSKEEEGENFVLEDEIDNVADLFIRRFHKQMRLQKLQSFKRFQEMMARSLN